MNLQQTVSTILKREVTIEEAKTFAHEQYGVLTTYNREWDEKVKPKTETKVYIVNTYNFGFDVAPNEWEDEKFIREAEIQGRVYSLQDFQDACNVADISKYYDTIRFITVPFAD